MADIFIICVNVQVGGTQWVKLDILDAFTEAFTTLPHFIFPSIAYSKSVLWLDLYRLLNDVILKTAGPLNVIIFDQSFPDKMCSDSFYPDEPKISVKAVWIFKRGPQWRHCAHYFPSKIKLTICTIINHGICLYEKTKLLSIVPICLFSLLA